MSEPAVRLRPSVSRALVALVQVLGLAVWFSATAVGPALRAEWGLSPTAAVWLTCAVQLGFVVGAVSSAVCTLADRVRSHRCADPRLGPAAPGPRREHRSGLAGSARGRVRDRAARGRRRAVRTAGSGLFCLVWATAPVADSPVLTTATIEVTDSRYTGTALTVQTALGFALTVVSIQLVPVVAGVTGWTAALAILALGPLVGAIAMVRLGRVAAPAAPLPAAVPVPPPASRPAERELLSSNASAREQLSSGRGGAGDRRGPSPEPVVRPRPAIRARGEDDTVELYRLRRSGPVPTEGGFAADAARALQRECREDVTPPAARRSGGP